eukprot:6455118-Amphidinium_carterae.1
MPSSIHASAAWRQSTWTEGHLESSLGHNKDRSTSTNASTNSSIGICTSHSVQPEENDDWTILCTFDVNKNMFDVNIVGT